MVSYQDQKLLLGARPWPPSLRGAGVAGGGGDLETQELSEEHFPWKILPTSVKLICCDGHLEGFRFFLN